MGKRADQVGMLLATVAGILEDVSALAASAEVVGDPISVAAIRKAIADADALMAAVGVLGAAKAEHKGR